MWWWSSAKGRSNLERFLHGITPRPSSFSLPQSCANDLNSLWRQPGKDAIEYFRLGDLWDCYDELSAYGLGTQVDLNNGETVTQYYVPYLSALQIYTDKSTTLSRNQREDNEVVESESECWSDDSGSEKLSRSLSNDSSKTWDAASDDSSFDQDGISMRDRLGYLDLQYFEMAPPYLRVPLTAKINELVEKYPGLLSLRSVDISPASWMAVAWYPIYHIPSRKNEKDLSTCFLSYHTLSSSFQDNLVEGHDDKTGDGSCCSAEMVNKRIPLAPFGLATYKMQGDLWGKPGTYDHERLLYLHSAADSWLKQLSIHHHDYNFFALNSTL